MSYTRNFLSNFNDEREEVELKIMQSLDLSEMLGMLLTKVLKGGAVVLHAFAHNISWADPTLDE